MKFVRLSLLIILSYLALTMQAQNKVIKLYPSPPEPVQSNNKEIQDNNNSGKVMVVYNVSDPTLTVFPAEGKSNGVSVIIAPGGGFHFLAIDHEGTNLARILNKHGITAFVLKYRTFHIEGDNPFDDMINAKDPKAWDAEADPVIPHAVNDGRKAIEYVRAHAAEYKIDPKKIGFVGFSAGGRVAASMAYNYTKENRPDFVAPIYGDIPESLHGKVLSDAPPIFIACGSADEFGFEVHGLKMYERWVKEKKVAELHLFANAGHGFGVGDAKTGTNAFPAMLLNFIQKLN